MTKYTDEDVAASNKLRQKAIDFLSTYKYGSSGFTFLDRMKDHYSLNGHFSSAQLRGVLNCMENMATIEIVERKPVTPSTPAVTNATIKVPYISNGKSPVVHTVRDAWVVWYANPQLWVRAGGCGIKIYSPRLLPHLNYDFKTEEGIVPMRLCKKCEKKRSN